MIQDLVLNMIKKKMFVLRLDTSLVIKDRIGWMWAKRLEKTDAVGKH